ncbi:unnamed protein product [Boreogadus saida]
MSLPCIFVCGDSVPLADHPVGHIDLHVSTEAIKNAVQGFSWSPSLFQTQLSRQAVGGGLEGRHRFMLGDPPPTPRYKIKPTQPPPRKVAPKGVAQRHLSACVRDPCLPIDDSGKLSTY